MKRKFISLFLVTLMLILNVGFVFANDNTSTDSAVDTTLNSIDTQKREKIMDTFSLVYIVVTSEHPTFIEKSVADLEKDMLKTIEHLAQLSEDDLDEFINKEIIRTIKVVSDTPNAYLTDSAYKTLEKYNFANEVAQLKEAKAARENFRSNIILNATPDRSYNATRYITYSTTFWGTVGGVKANANWKVLSSKITTYNVTCSGSNGTHLWQYTIVAKKGIQNSGQRAQVNLNTKFDHLLLPSTLWFESDVWMYNDGGIDIF